MLATICLISGFLSVFQTLFVMAIVFFVIIYPVVFIVQMVRGGKKPIVHAEPNKTEPVYYDRLVESVEDIDELKEKGIISEEEYAYQKESLLKRKGE